jgi:uncharacterized protein YabE (DUF348 family)
MHRLKDKIQTSYHLGKTHAHRFYRHPASLPLVLFFVLVAIGLLLMQFGLKHNAEQLTITPNENFIVLLRADGVQRTVPTNAHTVGELLEKTHVTLGKGDRVEPAESAPITVDNFLVNVYRAAPLTVIDGANIITAFNAGATPRSMVTQAGVQLYPEDIVVFAPTDNFVTQHGIGNRVVIDRAMPVTVSLYSSEPFVVRTHAKTVGDWIAAARVKITKDDTVKPSTATPITPGMQIAVVRNGIHTVTTNEVIPAPVRTIIDSSLSFGSQAVRQEGSAGKQTKTYQVVVENGEEVSRKLLQTVITVQPVQRIVAKGNTVNIPADKQAVMAAAGINPNDYPYVDYVFSRESHWNASAVSSNGYYGLGQTSLTNLTSACPNWQSDPVCQTKFFTRYAGRYGGWEGSYNAWLRQGWW